MTASREALLKKCVRDIPDFPKKGIIFKDITPVLKDPHHFKCVIDLMTDHLVKKKIDYVVGIESRGFIFSPVIAYKLKAGFVPVRKKGKLPAAKESISYDLEYGVDSLEIHIDAF